MTNQLLKNYRILPIDDDRSLCEVMEFSLKKRDYRVEKFWLKKHQPGAGLITT